MSFSEVLSGSDSGDFYRRRNHNNKSSSFVSFESGGDESLCKSWMALKC
jgi:hypothetical protein